MPQKRLLTTSGLASPRGAARRGISDRAVRGGLGPAAGPLSTGHRVGRVVGAWRPGELPPHHGGVRLGRRSGMSRAAVCTRARQQGRRVRLPVIRNNFTPESARGSSPGVGPENPNQWKYLTFVPAMITLQPCCFANLFSAREKGLDHVTHRLHLARIHRHMVPLTCVHADRDRRSAPPSRGL